MTYECKVSKFALFDTFRHNKRVEILINKEKVMETPKSKTAKLEDFYGKEYQFYILQALKNGEGEHDFRHDNRRLNVFSSSSIDEDLAIKIREAVCDVIEKHKMGIV
jgi:hypothetical protein